MPRRRRQPTDLVSFALSFKVVARRTKSAVAKEKRVGRKVGSLPNICISLNRIPLNDLLRGASSAQEYFERCAGDDRVRAAALLQPPSALLSLPASSSSSSNQQQQQQQRQPVGRSTRSNSAMPGLIVNPFPPGRSVGALNEDQPIASTSTFPSATNEKKTDKKTAVSKKSADPPPADEYPKSKYIGKIDLRTVFQTKCEKVVMVVVMMMMPCLPV